MEAHSVRASASPWPNPGLADLANSSFTATSTASSGGGCGIVHLNFDAVYPGSAAVGNVTLHIAGCVSDPYTYTGSFTITTGVGTLSGSAQGTVTEQKLESISSRAIR